MTGDWQIGDLALCVRGGKIPTNTAHTQYPDTGAVYTVRFAAIAEFNFGEALALWFEDAPQNINGEKMWGAGRFIKVTPEEADEFDREVIELMRERVS